MPEQSKYASFSHRDGAVESEEVAMPTTEEIAGQQKLLAMYRELLAGYQWQQEQWESADMPAFLRDGIAAIRHHIMAIKGTLRGWQIAVDDHPDEQLPADDLAGEVARQRMQLRMQRDQLARELLLQKKYGELSPPTTLDSIRRARSNIQLIKAFLRAQNVDVDDQSDDD